MAKFDILGSPTDRRLGMRATEWFDGLILLLLWTDTLHSLLPGSSH